MHFYNNMFLYTESDLVEHCILDMHTFLSIQLLNFK